MSHSQGIGIAAVDTENLVPEGKSDEEGNCGEDETPLDAAVAIATPGPHAAAAAGLSRQHHAGLAEADGKIVVDVGDVHTDAVDGEGNRAEAGHHHREHDHAGPLESLLAENAAEKRQKLPPERPTGPEPAAAGEKAVPLQGSRRIEDGHQCTDESTHRGAGHSHLRERPEAKNQQGVADDIDDIAGDVRLHDDGGLRKA